MALLDRLKDLAQDKSGSWVAQAIWDKADGYMKVSQGKLNRPSQPVNCARLETMRADAPRCRRK